MHGSRSSPWAHSVSPSSAPIQSSNSPSVEADVMPDRGPARLHPLDDRAGTPRRRAAPVFGMVGDIFQLIVEQPRVDRVEHAARPDRAVPADQMARMVHRQRRDPVALADPQLAQRLGHLQRIVADSGPVGAGFAAIGPAGDDFARAVLARGVIDQVRVTRRSQSCMAPSIRPLPNSAALRRRVCRCPAPRRAVSDTLAIPSMLAKRSASSPSSWKSRPSRTSGSILAAGAQPREHFAAPVRPAGQQRGQFGRRLGPQHVELQHHAAPRSSPRLAAAPRAR